MKYIDVTVILFWVIVPVLSEQITSQQPSVSTECIFLTIALCFASLATPKLIIIVITAGMLSGIAATEIATAVKKASITLSGEMQTSIIKVTTAIPSTRKVSSFPTSLMLF